MPDPTSAGRPGAQTAPVATPGSPPAARPGAPARAVVEAHGALARDARAVLEHVDGARTRIAEHVHQVREDAARTELRGLTIDRLAEVTDKNLRLRALLDAGYTTVDTLLGVSPDALEAHEGIGPHTARSVVAAVEQLAEAVRGGVPMRIVLDAEDRTGTLLLQELSVLLRLDPLVAPHRTELDDYSRAVAELLPATEPALHGLTFALRRRRTKDAALAAVAALAGWDPWLASTGLPATVARLVDACTAPGPGPVAVWEDFEARSVDYYTVLGEIVPMVPDLLAATGMLPSELADRVEAYPLDTSLLRASLRGYQAFGAKFALNQGRVLLGDEMGLGKTVQAVAAMAHCTAEGGTHMLVVCPASVLVGWLREVPRHSRLTAHRLHGPGRDAAIATWLRDGGVGVTTFEGLQHVPRTGPVPAVLVVDEAHLVKNPRSRRAQEVALWTERCWRVLLMTGTPLENRLEEFLVLVGALQPDLVASLPRHLALTGADVLRRTMAPVYLRRNTEDVLVELPGLVEHAEWEELTPAGAEVYAAAVASGSFMAMRRAAYATADPADSSKLGRLLEVLADAEQSGRKVVVFSFFRSVVDLVARVVGERAHGPLTGSVSADERQAMVDRFTDAPPGAVLVAQVQAGGVGLNIQAASVVVLCEPQLTPTLEAQAVARVRRMGQVRTVRVHRLLVEDGVDERLLAILAEKERVFDAYVRDSSLAAETTRSVDVSEAELARRVVVEEQARLGYGPVWDELDALAAEGPAAP